MIEVITLVIYDITDNKLRLEVAKYLKKLGLTRIQKSAFAGQLPRAKRTELEAGLRRILKNQDNYNVQIYTLTKQTYENRVVIAKGKTYEEEPEEILI